MLGVRKVCRRFSSLSLDAGVVLCSWELGVRKATVVDGQCGVALFELREFTVNDLRRKIKDRGAQRYFTIYWEYMTCLKSANRALMEGLVVRMRCYACPTAAWRQK
jgi:hypothetical protein